MVHDRGPGPAAGQPLSSAQIRPEPPEEAQLCVAVCLEGAVQLEVLVGQIGEDCNVVSDPGDALQGKSV